MKLATPENGEAPGGTILAFDFGERRIGVAVGERLLQQAHPLTTLHTQSNDESLALIATLIREWQPQLLVVGRPTALDGTAHRMTRRCERFADRLRRRFGLPVDLAEERLTSFAAENRLREQGCRGRTVKQNLDAMAAQIILQGYFDERSDNDCCPCTPLAPPPD